MPTNTLTSSIPTLTSAAQLQQMMQVWKNTLSRTVRRATAPPPPSNFRATSAQGGILLQWSQTTRIPTRNILGQGTTPTGADGYEILISPNGSFTDDVQVVSLQDVTQTQYFHSTPVPSTASFRIHAVAGTISSPQSSFGPDSGTIRHSSLAAQDNTTKPTTKRDNGTSDAVRSSARLGRYANQYLKTYKR